MATQDIRLERIDKEYGSLRLAQNRLLDKVDGYEDAVVKLTNIVSDNRSLIMENRDLIMENRSLIIENRDLIMENRKLITENRNLIMENREMLLAIVKHLEVPYEEKPPMGFSKE